MINILTKPMPARDPGELGRVATSLELLFDLVFVIAIGAAANGLHHSIMEGQTTHGIVNYCLSFFVIWWAWANYTWFASAYDNGDTSFRILTFFIMAGALTVASGVSAFFGFHDQSLMVVGYFIMRIPLCVLWLRAARGDIVRRRVNVLHALCIVVAQLYWWGLLLFSPTVSAIFYLVFLCGIIIELLLPAYAERGQRTHWHRGHISERYRQLTIIVLGETLLAAMVALRDGSGGFEYVSLAIHSLIILFSMWWLYFSSEDILPPSDRAGALLWGYGHLVVFAAGAAVGAGFVVLVEAVKDHNEDLARSGLMCIAISVCSYLIALWFVRDRDSDPRLISVLPVFAIMVLIVPWSPAPLTTLATLTVASVVVRSAVLLRR